LLQGDTDPESARKFVIEVVIAKSSQYAPFSVKSKNWQIECLCIISRDGDVG
jgi:hypothetical protein